MCLCALIQVYTCMRNYRRNKMKFRKNIDCRVDKIRRTIETTVTPLALACTLKMKCKFRVKSE